MLPLEKIKMLESVCNIILAWQPFFITISPDDENNFLIQVWSGEDVQDNIFYNDDNVLHGIETLGIWACWAKLISRLQSP